MMPGTLPSLYTQEQLLELDASTFATCMVDLANVWRELCAGTLLVQQVLSSAEHHVLVLQRRLVAKPLEATRATILEQHLSKSQKLVAVEMGLAPSTIALNSRLALAHIGVDARPSRAPVFVILAVVAKLSGTSIRAEAREGKESLVIRLPRVEKNACEGLPPAEGEVLHLLVDGASYEDISRARGTSLRTIANQVTSVFRRLGVSSRIELVRRLYFDNARSGDALEFPRPQALVFPQGATSDRAGSSAPSLASLEARAYRAELKLAAMERRLRALELAVAARDISSPLGEG